MSEPSIDNGLRQHAAAGLEGKRDDPTAGENESNRIAKTASQFGDHCQGYLQAWH